LEEIEESVDALQQTSAHHTVRLCDSFVVKFGVDVDPVEGENLLFIRANTNLAVPQVFAIYQKNWGDTKITYIVMENISGRTLISLWDNLTGSEKASIASQLREMFDTLRRLPSPGYFGSVGRRKFLDGMFWTKEDLRAINGPFGTEGDLIDAMLKRYMHDGGDRVRHRADYYRRVLPQVLRGNGTAVFTHNDLQRKNIIIRPNGEAVIVDWATSGWYPVYWEYATAMFAFEARKDDWHVYLGKILDEFPNHYVWMNTLRVEMWG
jgi:aminoglycoside phosphotransferase (APT) family kinase protein